MHPALAMEIGKPKIPVSPTSKTPRAIQFSLVAREIAEKRISAREQSFKNQALKDAKDANVEKGVSPKVA